MNVFTDEAVHDAVSFMAIEDRELRIGESTLRYFDANGRLDDYLNVQMRIKPIRVPAYSDGSGLWMSLTPMEVQSAWVPIQRANNDVVLGGLGLGYVPLRIAAKPSVSSVTIVEQSPECVALFLHVHKGSPYLEKMRFIVDDARDAIKGMTADFCWMDIYQTLLPDESYYDIDYFVGNNDFGEYRFWGQELACYVLGERGLTEDDERFFDMFDQTENSILRPPLYDHNFCRRVVEALL